MNKKIWIWLFGCLFFLISTSFGGGFIHPKVLGKKLKRHLGEQVKFTDSLLYIWKKQPFTKKDKSGYIKFETRYIRCLIRQSAVKSLALIHQRIKGISPQVLTFYGTVVKKREFEYYVEVFKVEHPKYPKKK